LAKFHYLGNLAEIIKKENGKLAPQHHKHLEFIGVFVLVRTAISAGLPQLFETLTTAGSKGELAPIERTAILNTMGKVG